MTSQIYSSVVEGRFLSQLVWKSLAKLTYLTYVDFIQVKIFNKFI